MYSRSLYIKLIACVAGIVGAALLGAVLLITGWSYFFAFVCLAIILLITLLIIRLANRTNRQISYFFDALKNKDSSLHFPQTERDPFLQKMYGEMNRINQLISEGRSEIEEKGLYYESILRVLTHEIRNSITPVTSLSADLLRYADSCTPEEIRERVEVIHDQALSISTFINSYHHLTHLPDPDKQPLAINDLFQKLQRLLAAEPAHAKIRYESENNLTIQADPNLILLALINLIRNAIQAIEGKEDGRIHIQATWTAGKVQITLTDNGPGIPPDRLASIFIPFYSTQEGGSGIGIPLSQRIMQMHGGTLNATSETGVRTTFTLAF